MKRTTTVFAIAAIMYVLSWFMPVVDGGTTLAQGGVPGWEAFRVALSPIWPYEGLSGDSWFSDLISVISGLTNLWFIVSVAILAAWPERSVHHVLWGLVLCALVNALWFVLAEARGDLLVGYYVWFSAFVVLATAAHLISAQAAQSSPPSAAT